MIVLHAAWEAPAGRLALWAEDGRLPRTAPARRGRPPRRPRPKSHPFALDVDGIRLAVSELGGLSIGGPEGWAETELVLRLPDAGGGPVGSPWLEDQRTDASPEPSDSPELSLWTAPGLSRRLDGCLGCSFYVDGRGRRHRRDVDHGRVRTSLLPPTSGLPPGRRRWPWN